MDWPKLAKSGWPKTASHHHPCATCEHFHQWVCLHRKPKCTGAAQTSPTQRRCPESGDLKSHHVHCPTVVTFSGSAFPWCHSVHQQTSAGALRTPRCTSETSHTADNGSNIRRHITKGTHLVELNVSFKPSVEAFMDFSHMNTLVCKYCYLQTPRLSPLSQPVQRSVNPRAAQLEFGNCEIQHQTQFSVCRPKNLVRAGSTHLVR